jgi:hypothetical protein
MDCEALLTAWFGIRKYNPEDPEYTETTFSLCQIPPSQKLVQAIVPVVKAVKVMSL